MGAYLSEPITEKKSTDEENERVRYGVSSMQGWRISQEDAHNCVIDFDKNAALFAVYDGHGGHEVAAYCAQKLPEFIKQTEAYKQGDFEKALVDAFLGFDATIATRDVVGVLKEIAGVKDNDDDAQDGSDYDEENVNNLYEEASMPIEQVMEKYQFNLLNPHLKKIQGDKQPISPLLKARKSCGENSGCSSSTSADAKIEPSDSSVNTDVSSTTTNNGETPSNLTDTTKTSENDEKCEITSSGIDETKHETDVKDEKKSDIKDELKSDIKEDLKSDKEEKKSDIKEDLKSDIKDEKKCDIKDEKKCDIKDEKKSDIKESITNGDIDEKKDTNAEKAQLNGEGSSKKGKGKAVVKKTPKPESSTATTAMNLRKRFVGKLYAKLLENQPDDSESDDDDTTFEGAQSYSSSDDSEGADDENEDDDEDSPDNDDEADSEDGNDDEDLYDDETTEFTRNMTEEPGSDSGCTAVLALLRENTVYVANAGDSRCIICRKGEALDMSFDHKPEDYPEMDRILKAGGKVTPDGRVNGGLNLSRAIGDHAYKQNKELSDREQMITALPDIKTCTINPAEDEFMVLACDGIWNFMSSQEVVDFIKPRLNRETGPEKLSQICEELFDHCLAPHTMGDGTGCDNMTAIIVQFKNGLLKRSCDETSNESDETSAKRAKTEAGENVADDTVLK